MDTAGPQKVSVLTTSVCKLGLDFIFKSIFSIYFILRYYYNLCLPALDFK